MHTFHHKLQKWGGAAMENMIMQLCMYVYEERLVQLGLLASGRIPKSL